MLEVKGHNVIVGIDRSGSMDTRDCDGQTRYAYLGEKLVTFVGAAVESAAGGVVTALFFNDGVKQINLHSADEAAAAMKSVHVGGSTATDLVIKAAYKVSRESAAPTMFFLVTDGHPNDEGAVDRAIIDVTKQISVPEDFRIMILTVGDRDKHLAEWLEHLDADLGPAGALFDIVGQNNLQEVDFREAAAELIASTTTNEEALAGSVSGKITSRID
jgi:molybdopterin-binding protein